jgi:hypothetical protein
MDDLHDNKMLLIFLWGTLRLEYVQHLLMLGIATKARRGKHGWAQDFLIGIQNKIKIVKKN